MAEVTRNPWKIKDPLGDISVQNTEHVRVVSTGIRQQALTWNRQVATLRNIATELGNLTLQAPTGESFFDDFLTAHGELIKRMSELTTQGEAAMHEISGLLTTTADAYDAIEKYNAWLAAQELP